MRETPRRAASSRSGGSRSPTPKVPRWIARRSRSPTACATDGTSSGASASEVVSVLTPLPLGDLGQLGVPAVELVALDEHERVHQLRPHRIAQPAVGLERRQRLIQRVWQRLPERGLVVLVRVALDRRAGAAGAAVGARAPRGWAP